MEYEYSNRRELQLKDGQKLVSEVANHNNGLRLESTLKSEREIFLGELENTIPVLRSSLEARQLNPDSFLSCLDLGLEDARRIIIDTCAASFAKITGQQLTDVLLTRVLYTILIAGAYAQSVTSLIDDSQGPCPAFPHRDWYCTKEHYMGFTQALEIKDRRGKHFRGQGSGNSRIRSLLRAFLVPFQRLARDLKGDAAYLTIDDHQFAASSKSLCKIGMKRKKGDKKAAHFGLSLDLVSTRYLGLPLATVVTFGGDKRPKRFETELILLEETAGWETQQQEITYLLDRVYGQFINIIIQRGGNFIATARRCCRFNPSCPFAFGDTKLSSKLREWAILIPEEGPLESRVCRVQSFNGNSLKSTIYYLSYRPGNGKVVLLKASKPDPLFLWTVSEPRYAEVSENDTSDEQDMDDEHDSDEEESDDEVSYDDEYSDDEQGSSEMHESDYEDDSGDDSVMSGGHSEVQHHAGLAINEEFEINEIGEDAADSIQGSADDALDVVMTSVDFKALKLLDPPSTTERDLHLPESDAVKVLVEDQGSPACHLLRIGVATSTGFRKVLDVHRDNKLALDLIGDSSAQSLNVAGKVSSIASTEIEREVYQGYLDSISTILSMKTELPAPLKAVSGSLWQSASEAAVTAAGKCLRLKLDPPSTLNSNRRNHLEAGLRAHAQKLATPLASACTTGPLGIKKRKQTEYMEIGTMNESREALDSVLRTIGSLASESGIMTNKYAFVSLVQEVGTVEAANHPYVLSSVDGRFVHSLEEAPSTDDLVACIWEHKTATVPDEVKRCDTLAAKNGSYIEVHISLSNMPLAIRRVRHALGHRIGDFAQIIHHAAVWREDILYTIATSDGRFIYLVRFSFDKDDLACHLDCLQFVFKNHVNLTFDSNADMTVFDGNRAKVSRESLKTQFDLRRLLRAKAPIGAHDGILPHIVRIWKKSKSVVNYTTKTIRKLRVRTNRPGRYAKVVLEHLFIMVAGAVRLYQGHQMYDKRHLYSSADAMMKAMSRNRDASRVVLKALLEWLQPLPSGANQSTISPVVSSIAFVPAPSANNPMYQPDDPSYEAAIVARLNNVHSRATGHVQAFNEALLAQFRITVNPGSSIGGHQQIRSDGRLRCVLCCENSIHGNKEEHDNEACTSRTGRKCTFKCQSCGVMLCIKPRPEHYGLSVSCWTVWHSVRDLPIHPKYDTPSVQSIDESLVETTLDKTESDSKRRKKTSGY